MIPPLGTFTKLRDLELPTNDGRNPEGSLIQASDGKLYGMATGGGFMPQPHSDYGWGTIFSFDPSSFTYTNLKYFEGDGVHPLGSLMQANEWKAIWHDAVY